MTSVRHSIVPNGPSLPLERVVHAPHYKKDFHVPGIHKLVCLGLIAISALMLLACAHSSAMSTAKANRKNHEKYTPKEVFLVSDNDWQTVLALVPVTTWTDREGLIHMHPTLIVHEEANAFDAAAILYFLRNYDPGRVTLVGEIPDGLETLLIAPHPAGGAGIPPERIQRLSPDAFASYWEPTVTPLVASAHDYAGALMASVMASRLNVPLVFTPDTDPVEGKSRLASSEQLETEYLRLTRTDRIILVNSQDRKRTHFLPDATFKPGHPNGDEPIRNLFRGISLTAPFLAAAKHELIVVIDAPENKTLLSLDWRSYRSFAALVNGIDQALEQKIAGLGINAQFLTIIASPYAIPHNFYSFNPDEMEEVLRNQKRRSWILHALDPRVYADMDGDRMPDLAVGRIMGFTVSDASTLVARSIVYETLPKTGGVLFMSPSFRPDWRIAQERTSAWTEAFLRAGYTANRLHPIRGSVSCVLPNNGRCYHNEHFDFNAWKDKELIVHIGHGWCHWAGIWSSEIPVLNNPVIASAGHLPLEVYRNESHRIDSFGLTAIRKGAIAFIGSCYVSRPFNPTYGNTLSGIYHQNLALGEAFARSYIFYTEKQILERTCGVGIDDCPAYLEAPETRYDDAMLLGDPTLRINPPRLLEEPLRN